MSLFHDWLRGRNPGAVVAGGLLIVLGGFSSWIAADYDIGPLNYFGPGLFPLAISILLIAFGIAIVAENKPIERDFDPPRPRAILFAILGVLAFAALVRTYGGVVATIALVVLCAFTEDRFRPVTTVILATALSAVMVVLFVYYLGVPIRPFPWS